jgi:hypothetical protein
MNNSDFKTEEADDEVNLTVNERGDLVNENQNNNTSETEENKS